MPATKPAIQATSPISDRTMPRKNAISAESAKTPTIARSNPVMARGAGSKSAPRRRQFAAAMMPF